MKKAWTVTGLLFALGVTGCLGSSDPLPAVPKIAGEGVSAKPETPGKGKGKKPKAVSIQLAD